MTSPKDLRSDFMLLLSYKFDEELSSNLYLENVNFFPYIAPPTFSYFIAIIRICLCVCFC